MKSRRRIAFPKAKDQHDDKACVTTLHLIRVKWPPWG
jgi:hypothetical protein